MDGIGDVAAADALAGGEVADAEDQRFDARAAGGDVLDAREGFRLFDQQLEADAVVEAEFRFELREEGVDEPDVARGFHLRDDDDVEVGAGLRDDVDDVVVRPHGVDGVDAYGADGAAPVEVVEGVDDGGAGVFLLRRRDGVLEVEEDEVGAGGRGLLDHAGLGAGDGELGAAESGGHDGVSCAAAVRGRWARAQQAAPLRLNGGRAG